LAIRIRISAITAAVTQQRLMISFAVIASEQPEVLPSLSVCS
jgi:hypothetical protein